MFEEFSASPESVMVGLALAGLGTIGFFEKRGMRYLQYFQQQEYEGKRFIDWIVEKHAFDKKGSLTALFCGGLSAFYLSVDDRGSFLTSVFACMAMLRLARQEEDPTGTGKITLKMTERAKRIFRLAMWLYVAATLLLAVIVWITAGASKLPVFLFASIVLIQSQPLFLVLANQILSGKEKELQENFANEARSIIKSVKPKIIGITGSYGKTSTKVILADILSTVGATFSTPRSINSYMGMTREIRERMRPGHRFAVVEMGAYYLGSIKRMCTLTPPDAAIITAIGGMHLERFGSHENVFRAKSELAQAVPSDGILVVNGDSEYCRRAAQENPKRITRLYGLDKNSGHLDAYMHDIQATADGTHFTIDYEGESYKGFTKLLGKPMLSNILASFTMAVSLGMNPHLVIAAIRHVKTESNRLEPVKTTPASFVAAGSAKPIRQGRVLRLNDAYNSNPVGFAAALEVLSQQQNGRRVLVTPGMVELGEKQFEENKKAAQIAAGVCDMVAIVGSTNKQALMDGLSQGGMPSEKIKEFDKMSEAFSFLGHDYCQDGDTVLIENDLPDLYETVPVF
jgi:UDP-N-acetylmuramoyl-tripeptide--D-alanyl-D-alanine ligase